MIKIIMILILGDPVPIDLENCIQYPNLNFIVGDNEMKNSNFNNFNFDIPDNNNNNIFGEPNNNNFKDSVFQFGFGFDEINNQNFNNQGNNDFFGNSTNFNSINKIKGIFYNYLYTFLYFCYFFNCIILKKEIN